MERKRKLSEEDVFSNKTWSSSQRRALLAVLNSNQNVFITGAGGVGKSQCIKQIVSVLKERGYKVAVTAHTGIAALTIEGQTLWSFMKFNFDLLKLTKEEIGAHFLKNKHACAKFQSFKTLVIDEISMLDPNVFEIIDYVLQITRRDYRPFGGIQLVLVGDFFQLPSPESKGFLIKKYVFQSDSFWKAIENCYDLQEMWRQSDPVFISLLHRVRKGEQTSEDIDVLKSRIGKTLECEDKGIVPTKLYSHNADVDRINSEEMAKIIEEPFAFQFRTGTYASKFRKESKESFALKKLIKDLNAEVPVILKIGCQVMLCYNLDVGGGLVNGARGVIVGWSKSETFDPETSFAVKNDSAFLYPKEQLPIVQFANGRKIQIPYVRYIMENDGYEAYAWRIGIKLAWATSIHKSQSLTLDAAEIDLSKCFDAGMAYVALSRITSLKNLRIAKDFSANVFKIDPNVIKFYDIPFQVQKAIWETKDLPLKVVNTLDFEII